MASSDKSVRFVGERLSNEDPSEATSGMTGPSSFAFGMVRKWSLKQAAASPHRLLDDSLEKEEDYVRENEEEKRFFLPKEP
ncbi:UNVERIFIED_CONTAM: hypothetical protein Slati_2683500 [Sesamum latifolium]|uniref:Uncharacterized protein n=1 Tax=Sesamum latifolium TaxID=2727402 RepID=A0AAW2VVZ8_9LAMI